MADEEKLSKCTYIPKGEELRTGRTNDVIEAFYAKHCDALIGYFDTMARHFAPAYALRDNPDDPDAWPSFNSLAPDIWRMWEEVGAEFPKAQEKLSSVMATVYRRKYCQSSGCPEFEPDWANWDYASFKLNGFDMADEFQRAREVYDIVRKTQGEYDQMKEVHSYKSKEGARVLAAYLEDMERLDEGLNIELDDNENLDRERIFTCFGSIMNIGQEKWDAWMKDIGSTCPWSKVEHIGNMSAPLVVLIKAGHEAGYEVFKIRSLYKEMMNQIMGLAMTGRDPYTIGQLKSMFANDAAQRAARAMDALASRDAPGVDVLMGDLDEILYKEQCYLLARVFELSKFKRETLELYKAGRKFLPYVAPSMNASIMVQGDSFGFMNRLTQNTTKEVFFDATEQTISALQPRIRLYKITTEEDEGMRAEESTEFVFDSYATKDDLKRMLDDKRKRGFGAGIKDFSVTYDGSTPFSAKKSIKATLTILANSFDELMIDRGGYRYIDLALKTGKTKTRKISPTRTAGEQPAPEEIDTSHEHLAREAYGLNFRLKADVGWAMPPADLPMTGTESARLKGALNHSHTSLNLTPTIHTFDIDDSGKVEFKIHFLAYVEDFFDQPQFNIFLSPSNLKNLVNRTLLRQRQQKYCEEKDEKTEKAIANQVRREKIVGMQTIMCRLRSEGVKRLYFINISQQQLKDFTIRGPFADFTHSGQFPISNQGNIPALEADLNNLYNSKLAGEGEERKKLALFSAAVINPRHENLAFFYLSDLVDTIMKLIEETLLIAKPAINALSEDSKKPMKAEKDILINQYVDFTERWEKFRLVLGPCEILNPKAGAESAFVNLGDLPISVKYFNEWLSKKVLSKGETQYNLVKFLTDLFNDLLNTFMNDDSCFKTNQKQKTRLNQFVVTGYKSQTRGTGEEGVGLEWDRLTEAILTQSYLGERSPRLFLNDPRLPRPLIHIAGSTPSGGGSKGDVENETNYLVFFAGRTMPSEFMNGNRAQDHSRGIFHYAAGQRQGIIKSIKLQKTDIKGMKEVRYEQTAYDGLQQLREVYDVHIESYADIQAFPGTYIFVDPRGWAPNMSLNLKDLGFDLDDLTDYGLGGYYMIIKSEHNFGPGKANTKIIAKWVAQIEKETFGKIDRDRAKGAGKCGARVKEQRKAQANWLPPNPPLEVPDGIGVNPNQPTPPEGKKK